MTGCWPKGVVSCPGFSVPFPPWACAWLALPDSCSLSTARDPPSSNLHITRLLSGSNSETHHLHQTSPSPVGFRADASILLHAISSADRIHDGVAQDKAMNVYRTDGASSKIFHFCGCRLTHVRYKTNRLSRTDVPYPPSSFCFHQHLPSNTAHTHRVFHTCLTNMCMFTFSYCRSWCARCGVSAWPVIMLTRP